MKKVTFSLLSSAALLLLLNGCDGECCKDVQPDTKAAPVPVITYNGQQLNGTLTCDNAVEQTITLVAASSDSDGNVVQNLWYEDGNPVSDGVVQCPPAGQSKQVCLKAVDDDNLENQTCITVSGINSTPPQPQLKEPVAELVKGESTGDGIYMDCSNIHDQDTIDTDGVENLYGTDKAIKEVVWKYTYINADDSQDGPNVKTQTEYNTENGLGAGTCKKWFHTDSVKTINYEITVIDDDDQNTTASYTYNVIDDILTRN